MEMPSVPLVAIPKRAIPATLRALALRFNRDTTSVAVTPGTSPIRAVCLRKESPQPPAELSAHGPRSVPPPPAALHLSAGRERHGGDHRRHAPHACRDLRDCRGERPEDQRGPLA